MVTSITSYVKYLKMKVLGKNKLKAKNEEMKECIMKKVMILIADLFDEQELLYPYHRLREDFEVHLVGKEKEAIYESKSGLKFKSTHKVGEVNVDDYEALVIPGGYSPDHMRRVEGMVDIVKGFDKQKKPIAAICHAGWMLASAVDLKGKKVTSFPSIKDDMKNAGAQWVDEEVVVDENIITSRNPNDLPAFMKAILEKIG